MKFRSFVRSNRKNNNNYVPLPPSTAPKPIPSSNLIDVEMGKSQVSNFEKNSKISQQLNSKIENNQLFNII
jgi:hypothetical protein